MGSGEWGEKEEEDKMTLEQVTTWLTITRPRKTGIYSKVVMCVMMEEKASYTVKREITSASSL